MKDERLYEKNEAFLDVAKNAEIIVESSVELNNNNFEYYFDFEDLSEASVEVSVKNLGGNKYSIKPIGFYFPGNTYSIKIVNLDIMHFLTFDGKDVSNDNVQKYSFTIKDEEVYDVLLNEKVLTIDETDVLKIIDDVTKYEVPTKDGQDNYVSHLYIKNNYNLHKDDIIRIPGERESLVRFYKILLASPVTDTNSDYYGHLLVLAIIPEAYEYYDKYDLKISGLEEEDVISEDIVSEDELAKLIADQLYGGEGYSQMMDTLLYAVKQDETIKTLTQTLSKEEADRFNNASFRELAGTKPALSFGQLDISITKIKNDYGGYGYKSLSPLLSLIFKLII